MSKTFDWLRQTKPFIYLSWLIALAALVGSLYFSEIRHLAPCTLCWYQRIALYPLVALIAVGLLKKDKNLPYYVLPLSLASLAVGLFHILLQYGIIPETAAPCTQGISCATIQVTYFGFITIPLLSVIAAAVISLCMFWVIRLNKLASQKVQSGSSTN